MAQPIKGYNLTKHPGCCIKVNRYDIGIVSTYPYGPTSSTDFWAGYNVPPGGFVSYEGKASQGPSIYAIPDVNSLVSYGEHLNIGPVNSPEQVISQCKLRNDIALINTEYPELPQVDNNIFTIDPGYTGSYPWSGTGWYDISGELNVNGATLQGGTGSTLWFSGTSLKNYTDSYVRFTSTNQNEYGVANAFSAPYSPLTEFTISVWVNPAGNYEPRVNVFGQTYIDGTGAQYSDCNFLIRGNNSSGYEGLIRISNVDYIVDAGPLINGTWNNIVLVFRGAGNDLEIWKNNSLINSIPVPSTPVSNGALTLIGGTTKGVTNLGDVNAYFNGYIGVINVYNQAFDSSNLQTLWDGYKTRYI